MLSYSAQFALLAIDPVSGRLFPVPDQVLNLTLAGALLFDASFSGVINDDWQQLEVLKPAATGNTALDEVIRCLMVVEGSIPLDQAIALAAAHGTTLRGMVWDSLHTHGLLTRIKKEIVSGKRKVELVSPNLPVVVDLHKKIRDAIMKDDIPDSSVPPLISLMAACGLTKYILNPEETDRYKKKITWLANLESLGREIIHSVDMLESADLDLNAAKLIGLQHDEPKTFAGGMDAVLTSLSYLYKETGIKRGRKLIASFNQFGGFECPGCAWSNPDRNRSHFEFCENGAKIVSSEATTKLITPEFFKNWSVQDLLLTPGYWLENQGRLADPMILEENAIHYKPISWDEAFQVIADELKAVSDPDETVFYASGRTSNEAAFLYQLLAHSLGTNNLPSSANLCHEPSGKALMESLGNRKSSVTLDDFPQAGAVFLFGQNPGSNHPRMLSSLQKAVKNGSTIVAVNPMLEASLTGFADPQKAGSYFGKQTTLAQLYLQPVINGDMALVRGIVKAVLETEERKGNILDHDFIKNYTSGFDQYKQTVINTPWTEIVSASGVEKNKILEAAAIYCRVNSVIVSWCLGIVHHRNAVETIQEIVNLLLLKGNIGKTGSGVCPVRGQSNIKGLRTAGVGENMPASFLEALEKQFFIKVPRTPGMSSIPAIRSMAEGKVKVLISLGGNLALAAPDTAFVEEALRKCRLTVMISTKLNRSHLVTGKRALILPCLSRTEEDIHDNVMNLITIEDTMGKIGFSKGCLIPASPNSRSEVSIISGIGDAVSGNQGIEWKKFEHNNQLIRTIISQTIPALKNLDKMAKTGEGLYLDNPLRKRIFNTADSRAHFSNHPLEQVVPEEGELLLMTIRSHDQFNTSIFGLNDRYRGISYERRVLFMNSEDMAWRNIVPEQLVEITSHYDGKERKLEGYYAIPYPIRQGCVAAYFPEANRLTSINEVTECCQTPAYKSVRVRVK
ncbi:MAG: FdhF/YdeP family oxidoreductase [Bacteroidota bacterium]